MKKLLYILLFVPFTFFGQGFLAIEQDSPLELAQGWNMFGFNCFEPMNVSEAFISIEDKVVIVKDNDGAAYLPEYAFNGIGDLVYTRGYQIKLIEAIIDFQFCPAIIPLVQGCTDETAFNYNSNANMDDGSCIIYGCTNPYSQGGLYNPLANVDDGSCILIGCADSMYVEYYTQGFTPTISEEVYNDLFCSQIAVFGCTDNGWLPNALGEINDSDLDANPAVNYNPDANIDDGSCITEIMGCMESLACNYNPEANMADGSCTYHEQGFDCEGNLVCYYPEDVVFLNWLQHNYPSHLIDSTCIDVESASSYTGPFIIGPDSVMQNIEGIQYFINTTYLEINGLSQLIEIPDISGLTNLETLAIGYNDILTTIPDLSSLTSLSALGIGYNYALVSLPEFSELSNLTFLDINDNYSLTILTDLSELTNLDTLLIYDNNSLVCALGYPEQLSIEEVWPPVCVYGCMDSLACNFNPGANMMSNGSCIYAQQGYDCDGNITEYVVGVQAEGGIIFYIDETGQHGLVAAMDDLTEGATIDSEGNPGYQWGCFAMYLSGADGQAIGTGYQNTLDIISGCSETPIAASEALAYESEGYSDWYLPSKDELLEMYNAIGNGGSEGNIGGFSSNWYWSSSENNNYGALDVDFGDGSTGNFSSKTKIVRVRVIRAF